MDFFVAHGFDVGHKVFTFAEHLCEFGLSEVEAFAEAFELARENNLWLHKPSNNPRQKQASTGVHQSNVACSRVRFSSKLREAFPEPGAVSELNAAKGHRLSPLQDRVLRNLVRSMAP